MLPPPAALAMTEPHGMGAAPPVVANPQADAPTPPRAAACGVSKEPDTAAGQPLERLLPAAWRPAIVRGMKEENLPLPMGWD